MFVGKINICLPCCTHHDSKCHKRRFDFFESINIEEKIPEHINTLYEILTPYVDNIEVKLQSPRFANDYGQFHGLDFVVSGTWKVDFSTYESSKFINDILKEHGFARGMATGTEYPATGNTCT